MTTDPVALAQPGWGGDVGERVVERTSFDDFYAATWSDVVGYCASMCSSRSTGEEMAQETFSRVFARWSFLREPRPYVFRVATNLCRRHLRQNRRDARNLSVGEMELVAAAVDVDPHLLDAVQRLPKRIGEVVLLHYYADLSINDVAHSLRRPAGTIKRQLHEARALLAATLGDTDE